MAPQGIFASPRDVSDLGECDFYHTMEIPGYGLVQGAWDLRRGVDDYLGHLDFAGKHVLEIGTGSGFLCFEMERRGGEVVAYDLSEDFDWDLVPMAGIDSVAGAAERKRHIRRLNNGYWLAHHACSSRARVVHGTAYSIPEEIGEVDICVVGSVLLHLRDPFRALQQALRLTREAVVVTDALARRPLRSRLADRLLGPHAVFLPDARRGGPLDSWWHLSPETVRRMVGVLGFPRTRCRTHSQPFRGRRHWLFTVVGERDGRAAR